MRPLDLYALPDLQAPGQGSPERSAADLFLGGWTPAPYDPESDPDAVEPDDPLPEALAFARKLLRRREGRHCVAYDVALWHGIPFAILVGHGRHEGEAVRALVTDTAAWTEARAAAFPDAAPSPAEVWPALDPEAEAPILSGIDGVRVVRAPDGSVRLVPEGHADATGRLVFDEVGFAAGIERSVGPEHAAIEARIAPRLIGFSLKIESLEKLARACALAAIPKAIEASVDFSHPPFLRTEAIGLHRAWAIAVTPEGTYAIGPTRRAYEGWRLGFTAEVTCGRIGDAAEFGRHARGRRAA